MTKKNPQAVEDADILAYLEGLASPDLKAEIEASPWLMARAHQLAREESRLRLFLSPAGDKNDLELLQPGFLQRARFEIGRLIRVEGGAITDQSGTATPQPALVRGTSIEEDQINQQVIKLTFKTNELFIAVEVGPEADNSEQFELRSYVLGWDESEAQASVWCDNILLNTVMLDDENEFFVDNLSTGDYQIIITTPNRCIVLEPFSIS